VNSIAPELLNAFEPKLTQILTVVRRQTDYVFKVMGQRSRSRSGRDGHGNLVNSIHPETLTGFELKLKQRLTTFRR